MYSDREFSLQNGRKQHQPGTNRDSQTATMRALVDVGESIVCSVHVIYSAARLYLCVAMEVKPEALERQQAADKKAAIQFDERAHTPYFQYFETDTETGTPVEHVVWFDDARSIDQKLRLLEEYTLTGGSVWNIMRYFPQLWMVLNSLYTVERLE